MRPRISIRGFVRLSVGPSVRGSVGQAFLKYRGNRVLRTTKHQGTHRIAFYLKFKKIQENSAKFKKIKQFIGRIVVRIKLVITGFLRFEFLVSVVKYPGQNLQCYFLSSAMGPNKLCRVCT